MTYLCACKCGRVSERTFSSCSDRTKTTACVCGRRARYDFAATVHSSTQVYVTPDIPEHWNITTGCPIRSRRQLQELQKRHGWQDYEKGIRHRPTSYDRVQKMSEGLIWGRDID